MSRPGYHSPARPERAGRDRARPICLDSPEACCLVLQAVMSQAAVSCGGLRWLIVAAAFLLAPQAMAQEHRNTVVLLPIVIHSMDEQDYLRAGLSDMLYTRLARDPRITALRVQDPASATTDDEAARAHAAALGAQYVVYGSFTHFGQGASLDMTCASLAGEGSQPRKVFVQSGTLGEIIPALDSLVERITVYVVRGPTEEDGVVASTSANGSGPVTMDDLVRRVEALEQAVETGVPLESDTPQAEPQIPSVFDVYPDGNAQGLR